MQRKILYRIASVLFLVLAIGHTIAFQTTQGQSPEILALRASMDTQRFPLLGCSVSYGDFYFGFGILITLFFLFLSVASWILGNLEGASARALRPLAWALVVTMLGCGAIAFRYFVVPPVVLSALVALCIAVAEIRDAKG